MALCTQTCQSEGYILAGVEYCGESYCGNATSSGGGPAPDGLTGRWYPTAIVMANRSILVVGGKMARLPQNPLAQAWFTASSSIAQI